MLPILRMIPVGGVLLAIAIVLLALNPPQETSRAVPGELMAARGPLINRNDHPEWRQFLILAALRRAGELKRLRDLHDTVVHQAPPAVATAPEQQTTADVAVVALPADKAPAEVASKPVAEAPAVAEANPFEATPAKATSIESIAMVPTETTPARATPIAIEPAAIAAKPPVMAPPAKPEAGPEATPDAAATPTPENAGPAAARETTGSGVGTDLPPAAPPTPEAAKVAALSTERADQQNSDITGSIDQSPGHGTTIPLGVGEASSTEIEVFMPRKRPPMLRKLDLRRANWSRLKSHRRKSHRHTRVRRKKTDTAQQQDNFFAFLFRPIDGSGAYKPVKLNPYQPPQYRSGEVLQ
ncbi:MAG: hypothetical protein P8Z80_15925 [Pseudolabrys sp.]